MARNVSDKTKLRQALMHMKKAQAEMQEAERAFRAIGVCPDDSGFNWRELANDSDYSLQLTKGIQKLEALSDAVSYFDEDYERCLYIDIGGARFAQLGQKVNGKIIWE